MLRQRTVEVFVGFFVLLGIIALIVLALKVSGLTTLTHSDSYQVTANFDNIGDLKVRAPVTIAGVRVGQVVAINLDPQSFTANVVMRINDTYNDIPRDSSARILTEGLLGSNYISLTPGFSAEFLKNHGKIEATHSALILENLIGQLLFKVNGGESSNDSNKNSSSSHNENSKQAS